VSQLVKQARDLTLEPLTQIIADVTMTVTAVVIDRRLLAARRADRDAEMESAYRRVCDGPIRAISVRDRDCGQVEDGGRAAADGSVDGLTMLRPGRVASAEFGGEGGFGRVRRESTRVRPRPISKRCP
jgi:hypothetical protein